MTGRAPVTVVVTTWNHGRFIGEALRSVFDQTTPPQDVIVMDDGSTDNTGAIVAEVMGEQGRTFQYHQDGERHGTARRLNELFRLAKTEWVIGLGADDFWPPHFLAAHVVALATAEQEPERLRPVGLVYSAAAYVDEHGTPLGKTFGVPSDPGELRYVNFIHGGAMVRRDAWGAAGGFPLDVTYEDWRCWCRITELGWDTVFVEGAQYQYRQHGQGHRNYGTDTVRDRNWNGSSVSVQVGNAFVKGTQRCTAREC